MIFKFFITPIYPYGNDHYYHEMVALAEGLIELGHKVIGNTSYWFEPERGEYLIKGDLEGDFDVGIYCYRYAKSFEHLLLRPGFPNFEKDRLHILIDRNDWISPIWKNKCYTDAYDFVFSGNIYTTIKYPTNLLPWAMGYTNRVADAIDATRNELAMEKVIAYNFRTPHNYRGIILSKLKELSPKYPLDAQYTTFKKEDMSELEEFYYHATTRRHQLDYFRLLNSSCFNLAICGYLETLPITYQPYNFIDKIRRKPRYLLAKIAQKFGGDSSTQKFLFQHDSFRTWEAFYSSTCPILPNYETWNFLLPEMPEDGVHYLGINKTNTNELVERLESLSLSQITNIGTAGKEWAEKHYSPVGMATYLINSIKANK
jgi:hypothetical protein